MNGMSPGKFEKENAPERKGELRELSGQFYLLQIKRIVGQIEEGERRLSNYIKVAEGVSGAEERLQNLLRVEEDLEALHVEAATMQLQIERGSDVSPEQVKDFYQKWNDLKNHLPHLTPAEERWYHEQQRQKGRLK